MRCGVLLSLLLFAAPALAIVPATPDEIAIATCNAKAEPLWDSGVTMQMIEGSTQYVTCLEDAVIALTPRLYRPQDAAAKTAEMRASLDKIREGYYAIYASMDNEARACYCTDETPASCGEFPSCGSMFRHVYFSEYYAFLEKLLHDMARVAQDGERFDVKG